MHIALHHNAPKSPDSAVQSGMQAHTHISETTDCALRLYTFFMVEINLSFTDLSQWYCTFSYTKILSSVMRG